MRIPHFIPFFLGLWASLAPAGHASDIYAIVGRYWLAQSNLPYAHTSFMASETSEGKVLRSITSLARLQSEANTTNYLNSLFIHSPANIWLARDLGYKTNANAPNPYRTQAGLGSTQGVAILKNIYLPTLQQIETNLATITDSSLEVSLGRSETGYPDITLDYGDILMIRALAASARSAISIVNSQNTAVVFNDLLNLEQAPGVATIDLWLQHFPHLAKSANPADLPLARSEAKSSAALYQEASAWIRGSRTPGSVRLFNLPGSFGFNAGDLYTTSLANEETFRNKITEYAAALDGPTLLTGTDGQPVDTFNAKPFFDGQQNLRSLTPSFRKNKVRQGTIVDPTFGGAWTTNNLPRLEAMLLKETRVEAWNPYAFGLFVPPNITIEAQPNSNLSEAQQPSPAFFALGYVWGNRYQGDFGLFWLNAVNCEITRLNPFPLSLSSSSSIQAAGLAGGDLVLITGEWGPGPTVYRVQGFNLKTGILSWQFIFPTSTPFQWIGEFRVGRSEIVFSGQTQPNWQTTFGKISIPSGTYTELGEAGPIQSNTLALSATGDSFFSIAYQSTMPGTSYVLRKHSLTDGSVISQTPLSGMWEPLDALRVASSTQAFGIKTDWAWPLSNLSLFSLDLTTGLVSRVKANVLPVGRNYVWNTFELSADKQSAILQSVDSDWQNILIHEIRLSDGEIISTHNYGNSETGVYFTHVFQAPGQNLYARRSGDLSEDIILNLNLSGSSLPGLDFLFDQTTPLVMRSGNVEQPLWFEVVNDTTIEFDELVQFYGVTDSASESTFQSFGLTILDNDGTGVGIFATDNTGKEGRKNPDPFGFRFGLYDPIRYEVRRTGSTAVPLSVKVSRDLLLSSATPDDFEITGFDVDGQTVRIPAGQASAQIIVSPKFDLSYPEGTESLVLQISPDAGYALTENVSASSSILDGSPYEWWSYQMGLLVSNHPPTLDGDGDGMPNLLEMALGRDPNLPDSAGSLQQGRDAEGYLTLTFKRWSGGLIQSDGSYLQYGVIYRPQASSSLEAPSSWSSDSMETVSIVDTGDGLEQVTMRDNLSKTATQRFVRVLVTLSN